MQIATIIWFVFGVTLLLSGIAEKQQGTMVTGAILIGTTLITFAILGAKE